MCNSTICFLFQPKLNKEYGLSSPNIPKNSKLWSYNLLKILPDFGNVKKS